MTITYKELRRLIRFKSRDNNEIRFSDYDIREALNECIRYFNNSYALQNSDFLEKTIVYDNSIFDDAFLRFGLELPEDFISLQDLQNLETKERMYPVVGAEWPRHNQYKITNNKLYVDCGAVVMVYKAAIPEVRDEDDVLELPFVFKDSLAKITCMILENNTSTDVMMEAVNDAVTKLVPRRRYVNARVKMPFMA